MGLPRAHPCFSAILAFMCLAAFWVCGACGLGPALPGIQVQVTDPSGSPIGNAVFSINGGARMGQSDSQGRFSLATNPIGYLALEVMASGFQTVDRVVSADIAALGTLVIRMLAQDTNSYRTIVKQADANNARFSGPAAINLDGEFLLAFDHFNTGASNDLSESHVDLARSLDGGFTWEDTPALPVFGASTLQASLLRKRQNLFLAYLERHGNDDLRIMIRHSADSGKSWPDPLAVSPPATGYYQVANDRMLMLQDGRIMIPFAYCQNILGAQGVILSMPRCFSPTMPVRPG